MLWRRIDNNLGDNSPLVRIDNNLGDNSPLVRIDPYKQRIDPYRPCDSFLNKKM